MTRFKTNARVLKLKPVYHIRRVVNCPVTPRPRNWSCVLTGQLAAGDVASVWTLHHGVIKWKHFPRYWPCGRGSHRSPMNSPHKRQWGGALIFSLICAWANGWANHRNAGDFRRHRAYYDVIVMVRSISAMVTTTSRLLCGLEAFPCARK